jgi:hypothetical protein
MDIDDWLIVNSETHEVEMGIRWDGKTTWPLPEGTYAVKRNEADFSKIKYKEQEDGHALI